MIDIMSEKKIFFGIDYCKLLCAIFIVFMHTVRGHSEIVYWIRDVITTIAVPYFFIVSGFFFGRSISLTGGRDSFNYTRKYFKRMFVLYTAWSVLVIPVSLLCIDMRYPESSCFFRIAYLVRMFFLSGSCGIYWYILALLINCWALYFVYIKKIPMLLLWSVAILFFIIGILYDSNHFKDILFFELIHIVFSSTRNFLHTGLIYMLIGFYLAFHDILIKKKFLFLLFFVCVILRSWECVYSDFQFVQLFLAVLLFLISVKIGWGDISSSKWSRRLSMALYLEHFPILIIVDYYYRINSFLIAFFMMLTICVILYFFMRKFLPNAIFKMFYAESK